MYFISDAQEQAQQRCSVIPGTRHGIVVSLQHLLNETSDLIMNFKYALENTPAEAFDVILCADKTPAGEHSRRYNAPSVLDVAAVITGMEHGKRDIEIHQR